MEKLKDKKIVIYKKVNTEDEDGFQTEGHMLIHAQSSVWAYFKQLSGDTFFKSAQAGTNETSMFAVNWNKYLMNSNASDLSVSYDGKLYDVTRIDPFEGYKRDIVIYGKFSSTNKLGNVLPYDESILNGGE